jgi:murein DD-endopeptidase MepM/ murein hydrolase activator NlpD
MPFAVVNDLVDLFSGRVEFRKHLHVGDGFSVIYTSRLAADGSELEPGPIRAASLQIDGKLYVAVRHAALDGSVRYFDEKGDPLGNYFLRYPLQFTRISSAFSTARFHPLLRLNRPHNGVDFAAPIGTAVRSVADGVVVAAGYFGEAGNMVKIQHGDRYSTAYLHLSRISTGIRTGTRVSRGQLIGAVGQSGLATGPHLHFSLYDRGQYVNPLAIELPRMPTATDIIPAAYLEATLRELKQQLDLVKLAGNGLDPASRKA